MTLLGDVLETMARPPWGSLLIKGHAVRTVPRSDTSPSQFDVLAMTGVPTVAIWGDGEERTPCWLAMRGGVITESPVTGWMSTDMGGDDGVAVAWGPMRIMLDGLALLAMMTVADVITDRANGRPVMRIAGSVQRERLAVHRPYGFQELWDADVRLLVDRETGVIMDLTITRNATVVRRVQVTAIRLGEFAVPAPVVPCADVSLGGGVSGYRPLAALAALVDFALWRPPASTGMGYLIPEVVPDAGPAVQVVIVPPEPGGFSGAAMIQRRATARTRPDAHRVRVVERAGQIMLVPKERSGEWEGTRLYAEVGETAIYASASVEFDALVELAWPLTKVVPAPD